MQARRNNNIYIYINIYIHIYIYTCVHACLTHVDIFLHLIMNSKWSRTECLRIVLNKTREALGTGLNFHIWRHLFHEVKNAQAPQDHRCFGKPIPDPGVL
jgi:hypothetical protein